MRKSVSQSVAALSVCACVSLGCSDLDLEPSARLEALGGTRPDAAAPRDARGGGGPDIDRELDRLPVRELPIRAAAAVDEAIAREPTGEGRRAARERVFVAHRAAIERRRGDPDEALAAMVQLRSRVFGTDRAELELDSALEERRARGAPLEPTEADRLAWVAFAERDREINRAQDLEAQALAARIAPRRFSEPPPDGVMEGIRAEQRRRAEHPLPPGVYEACRAE